MALHGTTSEQLGWVAVTQRRHASLNPQAVMREPMTLADHQASRMIVEPLRLLDCCLISDGGVAIIVTSPERAADARKPPVLLWGMGQGHTLQTLGARDWWYLPHQADAVSRAYRMAGVGPKDIAVAQLYDNFTIAVLFWLEHAGFVDAGEAGSFVEGGQRIGLGGELPVNTAGGNLSESYMQGWLHVVEAVRQVRGEAGSRQVPDAELCLVTGRGHDPQHGIVPGARPVTGDAGGPTLPTVFAPVITELNRPFWDGCAAGELRLQACLECSHVRYPISDTCPRCLSPRSEWRTVSGNGVIQSWVMFHRGYHPAWTPFVPYNVVLVELAEGPRLLGNVEPLDRSDLQVGARVRVRFATLGDGTVVPRWMLVDEPERPE